MITAQDEGLHLHQASGMLWREGFYFDWHSEEGDLAGVVGMGIRPLQGVYEPYVVLFHSGLVYFRIDRYPLKGDPLQGPYLHLKVKKPLHRWAIYFDAPLKIAPGGIDLRDLLLRDDVEQVSAQAEIQFDALTPCYRYRPEELAYLGYDQEHYEQGMSTSGWVALGDGERTYLKGWGSRDHTWGERDWARAKEWFWLTVQWPDQVAQVALGYAEEGPQPGGFVWTLDRGIDPVAEVDMIVREDESVYVEWAEVSVRTHGGAHLQFAVRPFTYDLFTLYRDERWEVQVAHHVARVQEGHRAEAVGMFEHTLRRPALEVSG